MALTQLRRSPHRLPTVSKPLVSGTPASPRPPLRIQSNLRRKSARPDQGFWDALWDADLWDRHLCGRRPRGTQPPRRLVH